MIRAVLLDLDDTLLDNDMERFLPPYFAAVSQHMAHFIAPDEFMNMLLASTRVMTKNQDPNVTNQQAFDANFLSRLGRPEAEVRSVIDSFYEEDFATLKRYTQPRPQARPLVQTLFDQGYDVVIATNPLFPRRAIEHRLAWAGVSDFPFTLVTTYENSHFSKPNPRYYQEILDKLGCSPGEGMMVGDDFGNDIVPAVQVGLHTYWIADGTRRCGDTSPYLGLRGTLADCLDWVQSGGLTEL
jgi:HAD superfamily hydrolase (TIGR01662 family)